MSWATPIPFKLIPTDDAESFRAMGRWETGLPLPPHPGAFGIRRRHHTHEGVDLYVPISTPVSAVEAGQVVAVKPFTGPKANTPWWLDTMAVFVQGPSGMVVYGEIAAHVIAGQSVACGEILGVVIPVLRHDKGRPMSMLHLELRENGNTADIEWRVHTEKPKGLKDPTEFLRNSKPYG